MASTKTTNNHDEGKEDDHPTKSFSSVGDDNNIVVALPLSESTAEAAVMETEEKAEADPKHTNSSLDEKSTSFKKICITPNCTNIVINNNLCIRHGARKKQRTLCSHPHPHPDGDESLCTNIAVQGGLCKRHGAKKVVVSNKKSKIVCSTLNCTNRAVRGGVCVKHGATWTRKICTSSEGCTNYVVRKGVCIKHGATWEKKLCSVEDCTNQVKKGGVCIRHGAKVATCKVEGCGKQTQYEGLCWSHGGTGGRDTSPGWRVRNGVGRGNARKNSSSSKKKKDDKEEEATTTV